MTDAYDNRDGYIWIDGELIPWRDAQVHVLTHALHYGSSVFEGERAYDGKIFENRKHTERLIASAEALGMTVNYTPEQIENAKAVAMEVNGLKDAYVRPVMWRSSGEDMGVSAVRNPIRLAIAVWKWGAYYGDDAKFRGAKLDISRWRRPSPETIPCHAKAAGLYMICTMSKHEAEAKGCSDSLMFDYRGYVAEATGANVFFVKDGEIHTPLPDCFLNGITRQTVMGLLKERQVKIHERHILPVELEDFEQCWLTGTAAEVTPVGQMGDYNFEVGELTKTIVRDYEKFVRS